MTEVRRIQPKGLVDSRPSGFTQVVSVRGENLIFISGQVAIDQEGRLVGRGDIGAQTHQVLKNIEVALHAASASLEDIVKLTIYVVDYKSSDRATILEARQQYFANEHLPASTLVGVQALAADGYLIEIEAIAAVG
jgi:enamine deaminase RidA (YjgF/YER057c/UK114 family)